MKAQTLTRKRPVPHEHLEQCQVIRWAKRMEASYPALGLLYAVPNAARRSMALGRKMKAEGMKAGVPDLCLPISNGIFHSLRIEMKSKKGRLSPEQKTIIPLLESYGNKVVVCRSWQKAVQEIEDYLGINRQ